MYKPLGFLRLKKLCNMRVRILVASYYNTFVSADLSLDSFKYIIEVISTSDNAKIILDKDTLDEGDFSKFFK